MSQISYRIPFLWWVDKALLFFAFIQAVFVHRLDLAVRGKEDMPLGGFETLSFPKIVTCSLHDGRATNND
jgi:hypothetical protein